MKNSDFNKQKLKAILAEDAILENKFSEKAMEFMCIATEKFLEMLVEDTEALTKKKN